MPSGRLSTVVLDQMKDDLNALDTDDVSILRGVAQCGSTTDAELAAYLLALPSAVDASINHLQKLGYIEAAEAVQSKRQMGHRVITLSPKGVRVYKLLSLTDE